MAVRQLHVTDISPEPSTAPPHVQRPAQEPPQSSVPSWESVTLPPTMHPFGTVADGVSVKVLSTPGVSERVAAPPQESDAVSVRLPPQPVTLKEPQKPGSHTPSAHTPLGQTLPQPPQFAGSVVKLTQSVSP